jgi:hypothetical protein
MRKLPHTKFIAIHLNSPLVNPQWSYGSIDPKGVIYLKIWSTEIKDFQENSIFAKVMWPNVRESSSGIVERKRHIEKIKNGAEAFGFICIPEIKGEKLRVKEYVSDYIFELKNEFKFLDGFTWVKLGNKKCI